MLTHLLSLYTHTRKKRTQTHMGINLCLHLSSCFSICIFDRGMAIPSFNLSCPVIPCRSEVTCRRSVRMTSAVQLRAKGGLAVGVPANNFCCERNLINFISFLFIRIHEGFCALLHNSCLEGEYIPTPQSYRRLQ